MHNYLLPLLDWAVDATSISTKAAPRKVAKHTDEKAEPEQDEWEDVVPADPQDAAGSGAKRHEEGEQDLDDEGADGKDDVPAAAQAGKHSAAEPEEDGDEGKDKTDSLAVTQAPTGVSDGAPRKSPNQPRDHVISNRMAF